MIKWTNDYNIGIDIIDKQHQYLFRLCRNLELLLETPNEVYKVNEAINLICEFRNYITYHFYYEKMYFNITKSDYLLKHINAHDDFKEQILSINISNFYKKNYNELKTLINFLYGWIFNNITIIN